MFITRIFEHGIMSRGAETCILFFSFRFAFDHICSSINFCYEIRYFIFSGLEKLIPQDVLSIISEYYHYIFGAKNTGLMVSGWY